MKAREIGKIPLYSRGNNMKFSYLNSRGSLNTAWERLRRSDTWSQGLTVLWGVG